MSWEKYLSVKRFRESNRDKVGDARNEFESDFGRITFSPAIRRMHDKTQVFPLTEDDNIHTRLTHSLEVMTIGHSLGIRLCENENFQKIINRDLSEILREIPVLLKNSCLVHDIGNPPFGHFGESVIQNYFKKIFNRESNPFCLNKREKEDFTMFDGNAQGFRVLTKLQVLDDSWGLNLTYATLASYVKYPNTDDLDKSKISTKKRGVFQSEKNYLKEIFEECNLKGNENYLRHPLSFLMEAADSICYLVMDIEDGYNVGWYNYDYVKNYISDIEGMNKVIEEVESEDNITKKLPSERKKMVSLRIKLISRLVKLTIDNFIDNYDKIVKGEYSKELIFDDKTNLTERLAQFSYDEIFPRNEIQSLELTGHSVLTGLLDLYISFIFGDDKNYLKRAIGMVSNSIIRAALLENDFEEDIIEDSKNYYKLFEKKINEDDKKLNDYYKLRVIVDFISGMTDQYALNHFQKLSGQKII